MTRAVDLVSTDDLWKVQIQENLKKKSDAIEETLNEIKGDFSFIASEIEKLPHIRALEERIRILGQNLQDSVQAASQQNLQIASSKVPDTEKKSGQYVAHLEPKTKEEKVKQ